MIRPYRIDDTDALVEVWRAATALAHPFLPDTFVQQEAHNLRHIYFPNAESWTCEVGGKAVGFIAMLGDEIGGLFLDPALHGQGLGRKMVDHIRKDRPGLRVEVFARNAVGRRFYHAYGFCEVRRYQHEGSGEITLCLELPAPELPEEH